MLNDLIKLIGLRNQLSILEVGGGIKPLLTQINPKKHQLLIIDQENNAPEGCDIQWKKEDILQLSPKFKFDIIIDSLCWHEQSKEMWPPFIAHLKSLLSPKGIIIGEHAICHDRMNFSQENLLYLDETFELFEQIENTIKQVKFIPPARLVEETFLKNKLEIKRFYINPSKKIICNRSDSNTYPTDPDILEYQVTI